MPLLKLTPEAAHNLLDLAARADRIAMLSETERQSLRNLANQLKHLKETEP